MNKKTKRKAPVATAALAHPVVSLGQTLQWAAKELEEVQAGHVGTAKLDALFVKVMDRVDKMLGSKTPAVQVQAVRGFTRLAEMMANSRARGLEYSGQACAAVAMIEVAKIQAAVDARDRNAAQTPRTLAERMAEMDTQRQGGTQ